MVMPEDPPRRKLEPEGDYISRKVRWTNWFRREPCVDLSYISDTEVAEYRAWAGTKKYHDDWVRDVCRSFEKG